MSSKSLRVVQLSDIHISSCGELYNDVDTRENFKKTLKASNLQSEDLLVLSGDIAAIKGDIEIYKWVKSQTDKLPCSVLFLPGNHDSPEIMTLVFDLSNTENKGQLYGVLTKLEWNIYFLDTSTNSISLKQLDWLYEHLEKSQNQSILFMHHPPASCGSKFIDKRYPLKNRDEMEKVLLANHKLKAVFCGHYHNEDCVKLGNIDIYLTPSTAFQIEDSLGGKAETCLKIKSIGWREILLKENILTTNVKYLS